MPELTQERPFRSQALEWLTWKVLAPVVLILFFWPVFAIVLKLPNAYSEACAPGELLLFSAVILIEAGGQGRHDPTERFRLELVRVGALLLGVIMVGALVVIKMDAVEQRDERILTLYSCFACSVAIFSIVVSFLAFAMASKREGKAAITDLAAGGSQ